jgi:hypothetical protein
MKPAAKVIWTLLTVALTALTVFSIMKTIQLFKEMSDMIGSF